MAKEALSIYTHVKLHPKWLDVEKNIIQFGHIFTGASIDLFILQYSNSNGLRFAPASE